MECVFAVFAAACSQNEAELDTVELDEASSTETETETDTETGDDDGERAWQPARGIAIVEVEANQAMRVPIGLAEGAWVEPEARSTRLLRERDTLIRVHVDVVDGWMPHPVTARLLLTTPAGPTFVRSQTAWIEGDSARGVLGSTFHFSLAASESIPAALYQVELVEASEHAQPELPDLEARTPSVGPRAIGFEDVDMTLELHVVPIRRGSSTTKVTKDQLNRIAADLHAVLPVQRVTVTLAPPLAVDELVVDRVQLLDALSGLRQDTGLSARVHVLGLTDCLSTPDCPGGFSSLHAEATPDAAAQRVSVVERGAAGEDVRESVLRAIALNLGRLVPPCPTDSGTDPAYPHFDGTIGDWGADPITLELYDPDETYDFASACAPGWVSDYGWAAMFDRIATLSDW